jgi:predicted restriction endonuclease
MAKILKDCFKFDQPSGLINAKSKKKINITFKPTLRFNFDIHLVCIAKEKVVKELESSISNTVIEKCFAGIHAMGDFPLLRLTDVRNDHISTANLWEKYNLTSLNKELLTPLNESELGFNSSEKTNQSIHDL